MSSRQVAPLFFEESFDKKGANNRRVCMVGIFVMMMTKLYLQTSLPLSDWNSERKYRAAARLNFKKYLIKYQEIFRQSVFIVERLFRVKWPL